MHNERRDGNMKTIHLTDEEADAIDCALGIVLGMAEGAKIVSLRAAMESARDKLTAKQLYEAPEKYLDPETGESRQRWVIKEFTQPFPGMEG